MYTTRLSQVAVHFPCYLEMIMNDSQELSAGCNGQKRTDFEWTPSTKTIYLHRNFNYLEDRYCPNIAYYHYIM